MLNLTAMGRSPAFPELCSAPYLALPPPEIALSGHSSRISRGQEEQDREHDKEHGWNGQCPDLAPVRLPYPSRPWPPPMEPYRPNSSICINWSYLPRSAIGAGPSRGSSRLRQESLLLYSPVCPPPCFRCLAPLKPNAAYCSTGFYGLHRHERP